MYPADTLEQARVFYDRPNVVERILMLKQEGWSVTPNFHFGFMAKGFDWTTTTLSLAEYLRYWQQNIRHTTQIERQDWNGTSWYKRKLLNPPTVRSSIAILRTPLAVTKPAHDQESDVHSFGTLTKVHAWMPAGN
jgi:hypothetical protein